MPPPPAPPPGAMAAADMAPSPAAGGGSKAASAEEALLGGAGCGPGALPTRRELSFPSGNAPISHALSIMGMALGSKPW